MIGDTRTVAADHLNKGAWPIVGLADWISRRTMAIPILPLGIILILNLEERPMSAIAEQLLQAALALPDEDRLEFVEALAASLRPEDRPPFDESWREVILRRSAELHSGAVTPVPWSDVKQQARERFGG
jgi:putative addiction module component (TIGR02574 family)